MLAEYVKTMTVADRPAKSLKNPTMSSDWELSSPIQLPSIKSRYTWGESFEIFLCSRQLISCPPGHYFRPRQIFLPWCSVEPHWVPGRLWGGEPLRPWCTASRRCRRWRRSLSSPSSSPRLSWWDHRRCRHLGSHHWTPTPRTRPRPSRSVWGPCCVPDSGYSPSVSATDGLDIRKENFTSYRFQAK